MLRKELINRINKLKSDYDDFKSEWWKNCFVSFTIKTAVLKDEFDNDEEFEKEISSHISEVIFEELNDKDLVRLFEYVIRDTIDCTNARVEEFFSIAESITQELIEDKNNLKKNIIKYFSDVFGLKLNVISVANWDDLDEFCKVHNCSKDFVITTINEYIKNSYKL